ncbi:hypothetical protein [Serratia symbiotica]|uniref:hypothetical protein n=1 Tax=Serratia symbiotica TaxID=138074 RepID=UPI001CF0655C|nr:hypothetical protein [Serratia symbiotica]
MEKQEIVFDGVSFSNGRWLTTQASSTNGHSEESDAIMKYDSGNSRGGNMTDRVDRLEKNLNLMESTLSRLNDTMLRIEGRFDLADHKFETVLSRFGSVDSRFDTISKSFSEKIDSASKLTQANIKTSATETKLAIILAIPAIIGVGTAIYKAIAYFSHVPA